MAEKTVFLRFGFAIAALVIALDQVSKYWVLNILHLRDKPFGHVELSPVFDLTFVWNKGVSFGLFKADSLAARLLLLAFGLTVVAVLSYWLLTSTRKFGALALGLIIGGALGNMIDRARFGMVVDFIDFSDIHFIWVFNVADSAISIGVVLMLLDVWLAERQQKSV